MNSSVKLPNFLIIGVQKAGTTSVYNYLKEHPQVYMSPRKETNFLSKDPNKDPKDRPPLPYQKQRIDTFEKYCELFQGVTDEIAIGEASPNYMVNYKITTQQIKRYVPDAKLIAILRNPADRAYSDYLMHVRDAIGNPRGLSEQIVKKGKQSSTLKKGFYGEHLSYFFDNFDAHQTRVLLYDDLRKNSQEFMRSIYQFIGVDETYKPDTSKRAQVAKLPKNQTFNKILNTPNPLRKTTAKVLNNLLPTSVVQGFRQGLMNLNQSQEKVPPLSEEKRPELIEFYREDILKLQELINRDLSHWLG
ncbi:sulfotransferase [Roseofilum reptotaenium CS-1145]|uniref:Sulfotransferase n=1 Tax=Roseofilum reptotaenium AO1-A TaxID=1925591 RepID=A0A1L9QVK1_9CYAN|nr:sulfotransferase [Roseofilum reptotaenium]MDB9520293.1 sulfotransferase [Roseofilum reptotaenium CS-1145]OJJ26669.1 sulfotransferase [Roseofilum reptotaenium AO1-A]